MVKPAEQIAWDWAVRCFGQRHVNNLPVRALRTMEESVELAQACGVDRETAYKCVSVVYDRPPGEMYQELGGVFLTAIVMCLARGLDPESVFLDELRRVLAKSPEEFAKRNREKDDLGLKA